MIFYYAVGGGLGHLVRARRVLEAMDLAGDAAIVTASPYARDVRIAGGIEVIELPSRLDHDAAAHRAWLRELVRTYRCAHMIADAFPAGIQGELVDLGVPLDCVARLLRWDAYTRAIDGLMPRLRTTWVVEELVPEHAEYLRQHSERVVELDLRADAEGTRPDSCTTSLADGSGDAYWVIAHSGPASEVMELVDYACDLLDVARERPARVLVATRCAVELPAGFTHVDVHPASRLFAHAGRIISAAGFNVMFETEPWRDKHHVVPFPRRFDDQYLRAARRRVACAGP